MQTRIFLSSIIFLFILGCQKDDPAPLSTYSSQATTPVPDNPNQRIMLKTTTGEYSQPIALDVANMMIRSYLTSINYGGGDNPYLRSLSFNADTLRAYLTDPDITTVKFMLAHNMNYINNGDSGKYAGTKAEAMTMIIVGMDDYDNYIYSHGNYVYDHFKPCPYYCDNSTTLFY